MTFVVSCIHNWNGTDNNFSVAANHDNQTEHMEIYTCHNALAVPVNHNQLLLFASQVQFFNLDNEP